MENFDLADALLEFSAGTAAEWNAFDKVIPENVVIFTTDTQQYKKGNGADLYADLPNGPSWAGVQAGAGAFSGILNDLSAGANGDIIVIANESYDLSTTSVATIFGRLSAISGVDDSQDALLDTVVSQNSLVDQSISGADDGKFAVIATGKMSKGQTLAEFEQITVGSQDLHLKGLSIFTDSTLQNKPDYVYGGRTYYMVVEGFDDVIKDGDLTFTLTSADAIFTIESLGGNVYKVTTDEVSSPRSAALNMSVSDGTDTINRSVGQWLSASSLLVSMFGGATGCTYYGVAVTSNDEYVVCGETNTEGPYNYSGIIVVFDSALNVLQKKILGGATGGDHLYAVAVDSNDAIFAVGTTSSEGQGSGDSWIIRANLTFSSINSVIGGIGNNQIFKAVAISSTDEVYCAGSAFSGSTGAYVARLSNTLTFIDQAFYASVSGSSYFTGIALDSNDKVFCCGYTAAEGSHAMDGIVYKFDTDLTLSARKLIEGKAQTYLYGVAIAADDRVFVCGTTLSQSSIIRFNNDLTGLLGANIYTPSGLGGRQLNGLVVDKDGNISAAGTAQNVNATQFFVKVSPDLVLISSYEYGGAGSEYLNGIATNNSQDESLVMVGTTGSELTDSNLMVVARNAPADVLSCEEFSSMTYQPIEVTTDNDDWTSADSTISVGTYTPVWATTTTLTATNSIATNRVAVLA